MVRRGGAHEGMPRQKVGCGVGWTYLIFRKMVWPLMGWKDSDRDVDQNMMMRNGRLGELLTGVQDAELASG